ncbi:MAG: DUF1343 domain-containing protein [Elusimicrobia bacterium]|nr:DUF1343 domain-containing protein [Elusimicrobiota bacterium]
MRALSLLLAGLSLAASAQAPAPRAAREVLAGIDVLESTDSPGLKGKRVGLITNHTGFDRQGRSTVQVLAGAKGVQLKALFSPEHGLAGLVEEGAVSSDSFRLPDGRSIPVYSLYGDMKAPSPDMLSGLDALVFDIQDVGARFYTYSTTMALAMEAAAKRGIEFIVLDRPNPINGETVQGPILDDSVRHFTAYLPIAVRHGMTMGELARLHNVTAKVGARLLVIPMKNWSRVLWYDDLGLPWKAPSPNMPDVDAASLYPGIGCFEASNISIGRGTAFPFRWIGAPWLDDKALLKRLRLAGLKGYRFEREEQTPSKSVFQGQPCRGVRIQVTGRNVADPLRLFAHMVCALRDLHPLEFGIRFDEMIRMIGTDRFRMLYNAGARPRDMIQMFEADAAAFKARRAPFLLY